MQAQDRTIITAAFRRPVAGDLHGNTSGDQMDLGKVGPNKRFGSRTVQF